MFKDRKKEGSLRFYKPKFSYIFCDVDGETTLEIPLTIPLVLSPAYHGSYLTLGTMLNSKSQITATTAKALKEALSRGVKVVVATGKVRMD